VNWSAPEVQAASIGVLAIGVPAVLALISYPIQKWLDRRERRRETDLVASVALLESIGDLAAAFMGNRDMNEAQTKYAVAKMKFVAVGNDQTLRSLANFDGAISATTNRPTASEIDDYVADLVKAIRLQSFGKTKLKNEILLAATPFSKSEKDK